MNIVKFPGIGLSLNINKIAFTIFGVSIYWYAIIIVSAIILAIALCKKDDGKYRSKV